MTTLITSPTTLTPGHYSSTERVLRQLPALFNDSWLEGAFDKIDRAFDVPGAVYPYNVKAVKDSAGELTEYIIEVALAGVGKNNIDIKVREGYLYIDVLNEQAEEEEGSSFLKRGISKRKGQLSFLLNQNANKKKITSSYIDGLLRVIVPVTKPEVLNITVKVD
jgi:HSP20 family molecular chaperone IbpA